jgi:cell division protein FtsN
VFHAPSFSAGVVMGAVVVLSAAYLPELMSLDDSNAEPPAAGPAEPRPALTFEFDDLLRNSQITANPEPYLSEPEPTGSDAREEILLQAASFRSRDDAERLRAALLLMDLPATTSAAISLTNGEWYRVTVGPFDSRVEAQRALTRLREKDIAAIWTKRPKS